MSRQGNRTNPDWLAAPAGTTFGVVAADAARARFLILRVPEENMGELATITELATLSDPEARIRDAELFSETRPGMRREGPQGPRHTVSDRREGHRRAAGQRFAAEIVTHARRLWRQYGVTRMVLAASPSMLGLLRPAMDEGNASTPPWSIGEVARDLTRLTAPALHDALADEGLLPPRGRLYARHPSPGVPL